MSRRLAGSAPAWLLLAVVVVALLAFGSLDGSGPRTNAERAREIASTVKCPTCRSQSAADSDSEAARAMRIEIARRVDAGESADEIRAYLAGSFGEQILLTPTSSGVTGLVWVLPVAGLVVAGVGLGVVLRGWQRAAGGAVSDDDRTLVDSARRSP